MRLPIRLIHRSARGINHLARRSCHVPRKQPYSGFAYHMINTPKEFQRPKGLTWPSDRRLATKGPNESLEGKNRLGTIKEKLKPLVTCGGKLDYKLVFMTAIVAGVTSYSVTSIVREIISGWGA